MSQQIPLGPDARADDPQAGDARHDGTHEITPIVAYKRPTLANVAFYGPADEGDRQWVLIDAALPGTAGQIVKTDLNGKRPPRMVRPLLSVWLSSDGGGFPDL